ncbi:MAG: phosphogluconate dehydrogenase (NAD(+)-dependent, decarboxylating) [Patescibacteria group bacterium]
MTIGFIGLGKMGMGIVERLCEKQHTVVAFDKNAEAMRNAAACGAQTPESFEALTEGLRPPRTIWLMLPHGVVDSALTELTPFVTPDDTIIDGGNSFYKDSMRRADELKKRGIHFLDAGVSGGPAGAKDGACVMIGGEREIFERLEDLFRDLAAPGAYAYLGASGAGHFAKMIHNGMEYGIMQSIAEGFSILKNAPLDFNLMMVAALYNRRSVIESRLIGWLVDAYQEYGADLDPVSAGVEQSGEGLWTVETAKELGINAPVIAASVEFRSRSRDNPTYSGKILTALRNRFGGHDIKP